jgi:serine/threonine-protein kinase
MGSKDFSAEAMAKWTKTLDEIFSGKIPSSRVWTQVEEIDLVLAKVGSAKDSNHMFFPDGGGMDLEGCDIPQNATTCLELKTGGHVYVVAPRSLSFQAISDDHEWSYFRLETARLSASGVYDSDEGDSEEIVELPDGTLAPRWAWDSSSFEGKDLPDGSRLLVRVLSGGPFVIFSKGSTYNFDPATYDARHAKMTAEVFKTYIIKNSKG